MPEQITRKGFTPDVKEPTQRDQPLFLAVFKGGTHNGEYGFQAAGYLGVVSFGTVTEGTLVDGEPINHFRVNRSGQCSLKFSVGTPILSVADTILVEFIDIANFEFEWNATTESYISSEPAIAEFLRHRCGTCFGITDITAVAP